MSRTHRNRGFTLTELLIATAIFTILMSAIAALFVASLRAVKTAYLAADAYETSRGAFAVVERDLTTVFTMRDYGDYYQFFGTPQGMTMVGMIRTPDGNTTLGRITYVMFPVTIKIDADNFVNTPPFNLPQLNTRPVPIQFVNDAGTPADPTDDTVDDVFIGTAALLRYVEPGREDLNTYPFEWEALANNPEFGTSIAAELDAATGVVDGWSNVNRRIRLNAVQQETLAAKKRELWIRMLSGQEYWIPLLSGSVPQVPNVWEDGWLAGGAPVNPRDFVVAENIGLVTFPADSHQIPLYPMQNFHPTADPIRSVFAANDPTNGLGAAVGSVEVKVFVNGNLLGTTLIPVTAATSMLDFQFELDSVTGIDAALFTVVLGPNPGGEYSTLEVRPTPSSDPNVRFSFAFGDDTSGILQRLGLYGPFFRYGRVLATSELDVRPTWNSELNVPSFNNVGNPLTPRIPEVVALRLPFAYERAYPTAPQFERNLEQVIDVPSAYARTALVAGP
jgi:prepilin-type N-terminal cleavage/methylation domain-containing protein